MAWPPNTHQDVQDKIDALQAQVDALPPGGGGGVIYVGPGTPTMPNTNDYWIRAT